MNGVQAIYIAKAGLIGGRCVDLKLTRVHCASSLLSTLPMLQKLDQELNAAGLIKVASAVL